jgi:hypothetical protein
MQQAARHAAAISWMPTLLPPSHPVTPLSTVTTPFSQDTYYEQSAKLLAEASGQMQQEVRNLFPTVANTGVIPHHHAPPAASWDAPADAAVAAKEADLEARRRWAGLDTKAVVCGERWADLIHRGVCEEEGHSQQLAGRAWLFAAYRPSRVVSRRVSHRCGCCNFRSYISVIVVVVVQPGRC